MNIFITGESGTIPQQLIYQAKKSGHIIVNELIDDSLKIHQSFKIRKPELDFTNRKLLFSLSKFWEQTDVIIHSGAFVGTDYCDANPEETILTNVQGTKNIVDICNMYGIKMIYYSTTAIFDTQDYSREKLITEQTKKNPQTLYGITKYAGEMIVEKECKQDFSIVRPVFGFGDFPDDLHSALTKLIYNYYNGCKLNILLDKSIQKTYTRVENIACMTLNLIKKNKWNEDYNIGDKYENSHNWFEYMIMIENKFEKLGFDVTESASWFAEKDYLHWHQISTIKAERDDVWECPISLSDGLDMTIKSVISSNIKPYWI